MKQKFQLSSSVQGEVGRIEGVPLVSLKLSSYGIPVGQVHIEPEVAEAMGDALKRAAQEARE